MTLSASHKQDGVLTGSPLLKAMEKTAPGTRGDYCDYCPLSIRELFLTEPALQKRPTRVRGRGTQALAATNTGNSVCQALYPLTIHPVPSFCKPREL